MILNFPANGPPHTMPACLPYLRLCQKTLKGLQVDHGPAGIEQRPAILLVKKWEILRLTLPTEACSARSKAGDTKNFPFFYTMALPVVQYLDTLAWAILRYIQSILVSRWPTAARPPLKNCPSRLNLKAADQPHLIQFCPW